MPITVADLVAVLRLDTSQHDPAIARSTQLTDAQTAAIRRLAEQARATGVGVLTRELQALVAAGNPEFLKRFAEAFSLVTVEAAKAGSAITALDQALLRIATGGRVSKGSLGDIPAKFLNEALLIRSRGQELAAEELGLGVNASNIAAARARDTRLDMEGFQDLVAYWNDAALQQEQARKFWSSIVGRGGPGLPPQLPFVDPLTRGLRLPALGGDIPLGGALQGIQQRVSPIDPGLGQTAASVQVAEAAQAAILARDAPPSFRRAGGDPSAILRAQGPTAGLAAARGVSGAASAAALAEQAGIFKFLEGSTAAAQKAREVGHAAKEMGGHFSTARMAGFQLGMSLLFTLEPALGRAATQIVGSSIIAFGMLPKPLAIATSSIVSLAAGVGELMERMAAGETRAARFALALEDLDLGAARGETDKARAESFIRDRALQSRLGPFSFNVFKSNVDELFDLLAGRGTKREQLGESLKIERALQEELLPSKEQRILSREFGVRQRTSDALAQSAATRAQSAMEHGRLDEFNRLTEESIALTEESIALIEKRRAASVAAIEMEAGQERQRQEARDANNEAALDEIELKKNLAILDTDEEARIATEQKRVAIGRQREAAERAINERLADRRRSSTETAKAEADAQLAAMEATVARLQLEEQFLDAMRAGTDAELRRSRVRAEMAQRSLDDELSRMDPGERAARGLEEGGPEYLRRVAAIRAQNAAEVDQIISRDIERQRDYGRRRVEFVDQYAQRARGAEASLLVARLESEDRYLEASRAASAERVRQVDVEAAVEARRIRAEQVEEPDRAAALADLERERIAKVEEERVKQARVERDVAIDRQQTIQQFADRALRTEASLLQARLQVEGDSAGAARAAAAERVRAIEQEFQSEVRALAKAQVERGDKERIAVLLARERAAQIAEINAGEFARVEAGITRGAGAAESLLGGVPGAPQTLQGFSAAFRAQREVVEIFQQIRQAEEIGLLRGPEAKNALRDYAEGVEKALEGMRERFSGDSAVTRLFDAMIQNLRKGGLEGILDGLKAQIERVGGAAAQASAPLAGFDAALKTAAGSAHALVAALAALEAAMVENPVAPAPGSVASLLVDSGVVLPPPVEGGVPV